MLNEPVLSAEDHKYPTPMATLHSDWLPTVTVGVNGHKKKKKFVQLSKNIDLNNRKYN